MHGADPSVVSIGASLQLLDHMNHDALSTDHWRLAAGLDFSPFCILFWARGFLSILYPLLGQRGLMLLGCSHIQHAW